MKTCCDDHSQPFLAPLTRWQRLKARWTLWRAFRQHGGVDAFIRQALKEKEARTL